MNKFTRATIKLYEMLRRTLPDAWNRLDNLKDMQRVHSDNPFIDQERVCMDIVLMQGWCEQKYKLFDRLKTRLMRKGLCSTDPWCLVRKKK